MTAVRWRLAMVCFGRAVLAVGFALAGDATVARAGLDEYVKKANPAFSWTQTGGQATPAGTITFIKLTSQVWQGITWRHDFRIYEPRQIVYPDAVLLFITGGGHDSQANDKDHQQAFALAQLCGAGSPFCLKYLTNHCSTARRG